MKIKTIHESIIEAQNLLIIKLLKDIKRLHKTIKNNKFQFTLKYNPVCVLDICRVFCYYVLMKHKPKIKYIKLDLEKEQKKRDKEILLIYKLIIKIIKRKLKDDKNKTKKWFKYNAPVKI